jgi:hypothetical protein
MSITELLQAVDRLNEPDLDQLLDRVLRLRAQRKNNILTSCTNTQLLLLPQPTGTHKGHPYRLIM